MRRGLLTGVDQAGRVFYADIRKGGAAISAKQKDLKSRLAQAGEQVNAASARLENAESQYRRVSELYDKKLIAQADLDQAKTNLDTSRADLTRARQAQNEAEVLLGYARIESPIAGRVIDRLVEEGDMASPGMPLLSLYNPF